MLLRSVASSQIERTHAFILVEMGGSRKRHRILRPEVSRTGNTCKKPSSSIDGTGISIGVVLRVSSSAPFPSVSCFVLPVLVRLFVAVFFVVLFAVVVVVVVVVG